MAITDIRQKLSDVVGALTTGDASIPPSGAVVRLYRLYKFIDLTPFRRIVRKRVFRGSVVVDVGAHMGFATKVLSRRVGKHGLVLAIEPQSHLSSVIRGRCPSATVVTAAAHRKSGRGKLVTGGVFGTDSRITDLDGSTDLIAIDSMIDQIGDRPVSLIKIDAQGGEVNVLAGARALLELHRPDLFIELWQEGLKRAGNSLDELLTMLNGTGYVAVRITFRGVEPVTRSRFDRRVAKRKYFDQLFVHESCLTSRHR